VNNVTPAPRFELRTPQTGHTTSIRADCRSPMRAKTNTCRSTEQTGQ